MQDAGLLSPVRAGRPIENLVSDDAWIAAMVEAEVALAAAQTELGIVPTAALDDIRTVSRTHAFDTRAIAIASRGAANPVVVFVEEFTRAVEALDPASANYVHRGSTSQDILDTAAMLVARRAIGLITEDLARSIHALVALAEAHRTTPMAGRTLAMHAVPTTFGAKVAVWIHGLLDAHERLVDVRSRLPAQLGGAAGTLASYIEASRLSPRGTSPGADNVDIVYDDLTAKFARHLGLATPIAPWHTTRTPIADIASALNITSGALGKIAVDILSMARTEVREVTEPAAAGRGESSAMPQKRNPAMSTLIRSAAFQVPALTSILFNAMMAEDERPAGAWHSEWQPLRDALLLVGGAADTAAELTAGLEPNPDRMLKNLRATNGQIATERISAVLALSIGKQHTKKLLQSAAFTADKTGQPLAELLKGDPEVASFLTGPDIDDITDPTNYLGASPRIADAATRRARAANPGPSAAPESPVPD